MNPLFTWHEIWAPMILGWFGGVHCIAMCGGVVAAVGSPSRECVSRPGGREWTHHVAFNLGRIVSYAGAGLAAGAAGALAARSLPVHPAQWILRAVAAALMIAAGLHLSGVLRWAAPIERMGGRGFARVAMRLRGWLPLRNSGHAAVLGLAWGWMPCGSVYSALALSAVTASPARGALVALAFGVGTLPWLLALGALSRRLSVALARPAFRVSAGLLVCAVGVFNGLVVASAAGWLPGSRAAAATPTHCATSPNGGPAGVAGQ